MQVSAAISFWDELHKIAATVEQLHAGRNRLGIVRTPVPKGVPSGLTQAGIEAASPKKLKAFRKAVVSKGAVPAMALMGGGAGAIPTPKLMRGASGDRMITQGLRDLKASGFPMSDSDFPKAMQSARDQVAKVTKTPLYKRHGGMLIQSKGDTAARIGQSLGFGSMSGEGRKASNIMMGLHEGFERKAMGRPKEVARGFGHLSPRVIMDEQNLVNKMTGPGSDEARVFQKAMRNKGGETAALEHALKATYGQRGVDYVKKHGYTKAMKKDLMRRYTSGELEFVPPKPKKPAKQVFRERLAKRRKARALKRIERNRLSRKGLMETAPKARARGMSLKDFQRAARKLILRR
jgi:hypothetical protein